MSGKRGTLHMLCGKIASGKSTIAAKLAQSPDTIVLSEDYLLSCLYPDEIKTIDDFARCSKRLRAAIGPHIQNLLRAGISVVLDFQANTPKARAWFRSLFEEAGASHELHLLTTSDDVCKASLRERNESGSHEYQVSEADFDLIARHFSVPTEEENFVIVRHD